MSRLKIVHSTNPQKVLQILPPTIVPLTREYLVAKLPVPILHTGLQNVAQRLRLPPQPLLDLLLVLRVAIDRLRHQEHKPHPQHLLTTLYPLNLCYISRQQANLDSVPPSLSLLGVPGSRRDHQQQLDGVVTASSRGETPAHIPLNSQHLRTALIR